jgi:hypothetical protein
MKNPVLLHVNSLTTKAKACSFQNKSIKQQCMGYGILVACLLYHLEYLLSRTLGIYS